MHDSHTSCFPSTSNNDNASGRVGEAIQSKTREAPKNQSVWMWFLCALAPSNQRPLAHWPLAFLKLAERQQIIDHLRPFASIGNGKGSFLPNRHLFITGHDGEPHTWRDSAVIPGGLKGMMLQNGCRSCSMLRVARAVANGLVGGGVAGGPCCQCVLCSHAIVIVVAVLLLLSLLLPCFSSRMHASFIPAFQKPREERNLLQGSLPFQLYVYYICSSKMCKG